MSNVLLGVIALSVLVMAVIQVVAIIVALQALKRVGDAVSRLDADVRPILSNVQQLTADAARATALAAAQVERVDRLVGSVSKHVEKTANAIPLLLQSARDGFTVAGGVRVLLRALGRLRRSAPQKGVAVDEEDALFIG